MLRNLSHPSLVRSLLLGLLLWNLPACGMLSGVSVRASQAHTKAPSRVTVLVQVEQSGEPIDYLDRSSFRLYETDVLVDGKSVGLRLDPLHEGAVSHAVLLVDMSEAKDLSLRKGLARGIHHFVDKVSSTQAVTVLLFDGGSDLRKLGRFEKRDGPMAHEIVLDGFVPQDPSRNLHGAVVDAMHVLTAELKVDEQETDGKARIGTLAVVAFGPDLSGRKSEADVSAAMHSQTADHLLLRASAQDFPLESSLGSTRASTFDSSDEIAMRLQNLGMLARKFHHRNYLVSYCSKARAGDRKLTVKVSYLDREGADRGGGGDAHFSAEGFTSGCENQAEAKVVAVAPPPSPPAEEAPPATPAKPERSRVRTPRPKAPVAAKPNPPRAEEDEVAAPPTSEKYR